MRAFTSQKGPGKGLPASGFAPERRESPEFPRACLCAVAPAPQVPQGLEYEAGVLSGLERDTVEQLVLRGVAGGDPPTKADIRACEKRRLSRADSMSGDESCCPPRCCCC